MKKLLKNKFVLFLSVIATLELCHTAYLTKKAIETINATVLAGQITWADNFGEIVVFFITSLEANLFYLIVLVALIYTIPKVTKVYNYVKEDEAYIEEACCSDGCCSHEEETESCSDGCCSSEETETFIEENQSTVQ